MTRFVVIDDSPEFLDALESSWREIHQPDYPRWYARFVLCNLSDLKDFSEIVKAVVGMDHVLLDSSLVSDELLACIVNRAPEARLWMFTGWLDEIERWETWRQSFPQAQTKWFEKPLNLNQVLATLRAATPARLPWGSLPLPCRLFDADFKPIAANNYWHIALDAFPSFTDADKEKLHAKEFVIVDTWCECPDSPHSYGQVRFHTFCLENKKNYLQMGLIQPKERGRAVGDAVHDIFTLMLDPASGQFTRARYFEVVKVPGSKGVLRLVYASNPVDGTLPIVRPIDLDIAERLEYYTKKRINLPKHVIYKIRKPSSDIWIDVVGHKGSPLLDLPIYPAVPREASEEERGRVVALLVFDRVGWKEKEAKEADDTSGDMITDGMIMRLEPRLMKAINYLRQALKKEAEAVELEDRRVYANWPLTLAEKARQDEHASRTSDLTYLEREIMSTAKDYTEADTVLLAIRPPMVDYLQIRALDDEIMDDLRLPLDHENFASVQCARLGMPVYFPTYQSLSREQRISEEDWRAALAHLGLGEAECDQRAAKCQTKLEEANSIVSLPVKYDEKVLGVLALRHHESFHFTERRIKVVQTLITYAQPYLHHARAREARDAWDTMIIHNLRTGLSDIRAQADYVLDPSPTITPEAAAQHILARTDEMKELGNQVMYLLGYEDKDDKGLIPSYDHAAPLGKLKEIWDSVNWLPEAADKSLEVDPSAVKMSNGLLLYDPRDYLPHILRNLLHNAVIYGQSGPIVAKAIIADGYWVLTLTNPGQFSDSVLRREFRDLSSREDLGQKSMRVHIGLAACYRLLEEVNGNLTPSNETRDGREYAKVKLRWPLKSTE